MTYLRKLLKKTGFLPVLELHPFQNLYIIELLLVKIWVQLNISEDETRDELNNIEKNNYLKTESGKEIRKMNIHSFSNMSINKSILTKFAGKENELILLLVYEFLRDLIFHDMTLQNDLIHLPSDFQRFHVSI